MEKSSKRMSGWTCTRNRSTLRLPRKEARHSAHRRRCGVGGRAVRKLRSAHRKLVFVYEAGPCGFWIYRRLRAQGLACMVVSPSMTPRNAADRVKTDRRDAMKLARLARAGELEPIYVPDALTRRCAIWYVRARTRCDAAPGPPAVAGVAAEKRDPLRGQERLDAGASALDRGCEAAAAGAADRVRGVCAGRARKASGAWSGSSRRSARSSRSGAGGRWWRRCRRCAAFGAPRGAHRGGAGRLPALRLSAAADGLSGAHSERGLIRRTAAPGRDHQSRQQLGAARTGRGGVGLRVPGACLVGHRASPAKASKRACDIAWKAQLRLCARFRRLAARGVTRNKMVVAIARELAGFVWAIAREVKPL